MPTDLLAVTITITPTAWSAPDELRRSLEAVGVTVDTMDAETSHVEGVIHPMDVPRLLGAEFVDNVERLP
jgi:hypothetical protein